MELVKQIKHAKNLNVHQLSQYNDMVQPYEKDLHDFMQTIYGDLIQYFSTYLKCIAKPVYVMIQDPSKICECEHEINIIHQHLEITILQPIQNKIKMFIRHQNLEFIKMVTLYFMLNIPMIIHLYSNKLDQLYHLIDKQKR